jgi:site-specific DNA recombinase
MQAIGYIRVSTQGQADDGVSLEAQKAKIEAWCLANDYSLVDMFVDAGISGKAMQNREGLQAALDVVGKDVALVAYSMSRLSRSTKDMLVIADMLERRGADLVSLTEKIDTTSAAGKMVFKMLAVLNEFERDLVSERTKAALAHKKANGEKYASVPFGFKEIEGRLVEVEQEARVVAEILSMREQGHTLRAIAEEMNTRGIEGKRGGKWYASTVRYLIHRQAA